MPHTETAYDNCEVRRYLRRSEITARIGEASSERLGRRRWAVERTMILLSAFHCLATRYDRSPNTIIAVEALAITAICAR